MKQLMIGIILFLLAAVPLAAQDKAPVLVFESQTKDFGKVNEGAPIKHVFKFANKGDAVLEIFKVEGT
jgi:hypothetical protein